MNRYLIRIYFKNGENKAAYLDSDKEMFDAALELFEKGLTSVQLTSAEGTYLTFVETLDKVEYEEL